MGLFVGVLFVVLTPGVLVRIPKRGKPLTVALVHGLVFAVIFHFTAKMLYNAGYIEGFQSQVPLSAEAEKIARRLGEDASLRTPERTEKINIVNALNQTQAGRAALEAIKNNLNAIAQLNSMLTSKDDDGTKFDKVLDFQINYIRNYGKLSADTNQQSKVVCDRIKNDAGVKKNEMTRRVSDLQKTYDTTKNLLDKFKAIQTDLCNYRKRVNNAAVNACSEASNNVYGAQSSLKEHGRNLTAANNEFTTLHNNINKELKQNNC